MLIGYARVSTLDQQLDLQRDALQQAGCEEEYIYADTVSGAKTERPGLAKALSQLRRGDKLVVWKLDRLGRSLRHLIETMTLLNNKGVGFHSLQENIDTTTPGGKLTFHIFAALAEFERDLIRERTQAGLRAARARGRKGGRKRLMSAQQIAMAKALHQDPTHSIKDICEALGVSRATLYRYLKSSS